MATDPPRPLAELITEAQEGKLTLTYNAGVRLNAEEFFYIDRDCSDFKQFIRAQQQVAQDISDQKHWGIGEDQDILPSAKVMVHWFRSKAAKIDSGKDSDNNVRDLLEEHYKIVDDIQTLHHTIAQRLIDTDQEFAARYNEISANPPPSGISATTHVAGPYMLPNGKTY